MTNGYNNGYDNGPGYDERQRLKTRQLETCLGPFGLIIYFIMYCMMYNNAVKYVVSSK
jgi:hypothetical protein